MEYQNHQGNQKMSKNDQEVYSGIEILVVTLKNMHYLHKNSKLNLLNDPKMI